MSKRKNRIIEPVPIEILTKEHNSLNYYPVIVCNAEQKPIGVSFIPLKLKCDATGRVVPAEKVTSFHWSEGKCQFLEGYEIDMSTFREGDMVTCPVCNSSVNFTVFGSSIVPKLNDED